MSLVLFSGHGRLSSRPVGKWPVDVTCGLGKESGYHREELVITIKS